jgi:hypothetical protein
LYVAEAEESIHSDAWQQRVDRTGAVYGEEKIGGGGKRERRGEEKREVE